MTNEVTSGLEKRVCLGLAAGLLIAFGVFGALRLADLEHNFDEGVYIQQARLILAGQAPYRDFFYHQTPLYLYTLAASGALAPDSLFAYRLPSLLSTLLAGVFVFAMAWRLLPPAGALIALILFLAAPLQFYGMLALPNGPMMGLVAGGLYLLGFVRGPAAAALGAVFLVGAVLQKPLALPFGVAAAIALLQRRRALDVLAAAGAGLATGIGAWALFDAASDGLFSQLLELQSGRFSSQSGFDVMSGYAPFAKVVQEKGLHSSFDWNVNEHATTFLLPGPFGNLQVLVLGVIGQLYVLRRPGAFAGRRLWLAAAWAVPLFFSLRIWEPCWDHYFIQYLPAASLLAAAPLSALFAARRLRLLARSVVVLVLTYAVLSGYQHIEWRLDDHSKVPRAHASETWLTFEPFLNFVSGSKPACGLIDPYNVLGKRSLVGQSDAAGWDRFRVSEEDLLACLREDPSIKVSIGSIRAFFVDEEFQKQLDALGPERKRRMPSHFNRERKSRRRGLGLFD